MAQPQLYSNAKVYVNGQLLSEEASVSVTFHSGLNPVFTTSKGWSGHSQGSPYLEISVDNAVPDAGFEWDPGAAMAEGQFVKVSVQAASAVLTATCSVIQADFSHSVNNESKLSIRFQGEFAQFE